MNGTIAREGLWCHQRYVQSFRQIRVVGAVRAAEGGVGEGSDPPMVGIAVALMIAHNKAGVKLMLEQYLVRNTTREEREKIIRDSLGCGGGGCENCSACGVYGAGDPLDMYQPYIEGLKEIEDINREFKARYFR
jgi:hypothetical protein